MLVCRALTAWFKVRARSSFMSCQLIMKDSEPASNDASRSSRPTKGNHHGALLGHISVPMLMLSGVFRKRSTSWIFVYSRGTACCQHSFHVCFRLAVGPSNQARPYHIIQVSVEMQLVRCVCASKPHPGAQPAESEGQPWECSCNHGHASPADGRFSPPAPAHLLYALTEGLQSSQNVVSSLCAMRIRAT